MEKSNRDVCVLQFKEILCLFEGKMRLRYWIFLHFLLLKIDETISSNINRRQETSDDEPYMPVQRPLESTSTTTKATRLEPWVDPVHGPHFFTLPNCDNVEGGDSECEDSDNSTQNAYEYDYATDDTVDDVYDYVGPTSTPNPEGVEEMDFVYGDIPILNRKIVNARRVNVVEHPYVVSIARNYSHYLVGTLVSKNIVITIAHPLIGVPLYELGVLFGETYTGRRSNGLMTVVLMIFHRGFDPRTLQNNIVALRFMADTFRAYTCLVKPISLHNPHNNIEGKTALVTGWGRCDSSLAWCVPRTSRYYFGEVMDTMLRTASFTYHSTPPAACHWYENNGVPLSNDMLCLGPSREEDEQAPCLGAPGAPLVVDGRLVGLLAWGAGCGYTTDKPLIYVKLTPYLSWLQTVVSKLGSLRASVMSPFYRAIQNFVRKEYLYENRMIQPIKVVNASSDTLRLVATELDITIAGYFDALNATIYDIRDFIDNGRFRRHKEELYASLMYSPLKATTPPLPNLPGTSTSDTASAFEESAKILSASPSSSSSEQGSSEDIYLDDINEYY